MAKKQQKRVRRKAATGAAEASESELDLPFEQALKELEEIVAALEQGELTLQQSLDSYEKGIGRLKICYLRLQDAERRIEILSGFDTDGNPVTRDFEDHGESSDLMQKSQSRSRRRTADASDLPPMDDPEGLF